MPDQLTKGEVDSKTDPSVSKQYDTKTPTVEQIKDFYSKVDEMKVGILSTYRQGVGTFLPLSLLPFVHILIS